MMPVTWSNITSNDPLEMKLDCNLRNLEKIKLTVKQDKYIISLNRKWFWNRSFELISESNIRFAADRGRPCPDQDDDTPCGWFNQESCCMMSPWREIQLTPNGFRCLILKVCQGNRIRQITKLYFNESQTTYSVHALHRKIALKYKMIQTSFSIGHWQ